MSCGVSPSGVQTLAYTGGQYTARVSTLLVLCVWGVEDRGWFPGDPRGQAFLIRLIINDTFFFGICRNRTYFSENAERLSANSENEEASEKFRSFIFGKG